MWSGRSDSETAAADFLRAGPALRHPSVRPKALEAVWGQLSVSDGVLDVPMAQVVLQSAGVLPIIGEFEAAGVPHSGQNPCARLFPLSAVLM